MEGGPGPPPTAPPSSPTAPPYPPPALPAAPLPPALTGDAPRLVASATHPGCALRHGSGQAWVIETADGRPESGVGTSLALDAQDFSHIAYQCPEAALCYTRFDGARWFSETVDPGEVGVASLALDAKGLPHISYVDTSGDWWWAIRLYYTHLVGTALPGLPGAGGQMTGRRLR